jgi:hypothetical protein
MHPMFVSFATAQLFGFRGAVFRRSLEAALEYVYQVEILHREKPSVAGEVQGGRYQSLPRPCILETISPLATSSLTETNLLTSLASWTLVVTCILYSPF